MLSLIELYTVLGYILCLFLWEKQYTRLTMYSSIFFIPEAQSLLKCQIFRVYKMNDYFSTGCRSLGWVPHDGVPH